MKSPLLAIQERNTMPELGEIRWAEDTGRQWGRVKVIWHACELCNKPRWVHLVRGIPKTKICLQCANRTLEKRKQSGLGIFGDKSHSWRGGRNLHPRGYVYIWLSSDDFFFPMVGYNKHHVAEHRLVMAKHLGRCLQIWELVHHKNGIKNDNRIENLELTSSLGEHSKAHAKGYRDGYQKGLIDGHEKRIKDLETRIILLEAELVLSCRTVGEQVN